MTQIFSTQDSTQGLAQELQFPIMLNGMTHEEAKEYHLKTLFELSLKTVDQIPQLDEPTGEQKQWIEYKMKALPHKWQRWFVDLYFTEEQKKKLGLTDLDIDGKGMR